MAEESNENNKDSRKGNSHQKYLKNSVQKTTNLAQVKQ
jgi:hypothetical protein